MPNKNIYLPLLFVITLFSLIFTQYPSIGPEDSGELTTSVCTLGIPHPPGYPLYTLLGKTIITVLPFGNTAYKTNIISGLYTSTGVIFILFFLFLSSKKSGGLNTDKYFIQFVFALGLALFGPLRDISLLSEVLSLNFLLFSVLMFISAYIYNNEVNNKSYLYLFSFLTGIFLGNHYTLLFIIPPFIFLNFKSIRTYFNPLFAVKCILFFVLGFSIYIFLYLRSSVNPYLDIGNPESLSGLISHILRSSYGSLKMSPGFSNLSSIQQPLIQFKMFLSDIYQVFGFTLSFLGLLGMIHGLYFKRRLSIFLFILFVLAGPLFVILSNADPDPRSYILVKRLLIPAYLCIYLFIYMGIEPVFTFLKNKPLLKYALFFLLVIYLLIIPINTLFKSNPRYYFHTLFYAKDILRSVKRPCILFSEGDTPISSIIYLQQIENKGKDIALLYPAKSEWFRNQMKIRFPDILEGIKKEKGIEFVGRTIELNKNIYPVYSTHRNLLKNVRYLGLVYENSNYTTADTKRISELIYSFYHQNRFSYFSLEEFDPFTKETLNQYPKLIKQSRIKT